MGVDIKYSVVIPVYNEKDNLEALYSRVKNVVNTLDGAIELIFVNDGSNDGSYEMLREIAKRDDSVVLVSFDKNYGQHPAVVAGFFEARGDIFITLDADLQNPPEEIPTILKELESGGYDMVSGRRRGRKDSAFRKIPSFMTNLIISLITGVWMEDYGSMLRAFRAGTARKLAEAFMEKPAYITMLIPLVTKNIKEIDVNHDERLSGSSKYGLLRLLDAFYRIFFTRRRKAVGDRDRLYIVKNVIRNKAV
jgi:undecaprenyl-phosphate 4-deoxy-4-formamido-L-arabinose transferase